MHIYPPVVNVWSVPFYTYWGFYWSHFAYWISLHFPRFVWCLQCCSFTSSSSSLDAKYSSEFNFSDAAWRLVMQHSDVRYPSESRAESTKEKASSGYILLSSHTAWSRLQLGWGVCKWGVLTAHWSAVKFMPVVNQLPLDTQKTKYLR